MLTAGVLAGMTLWGLYHMAISETTGEIIAKNKKGAINREFPSDMRNKTLDEINKLARQGNKDAKKVKKLLTDKRFDKGDNWK